MPRQKLWKCDPLKSQVRNSFLAAVFSLIEMLSLEHSLVCTTGIAFEKAWHDLMFSFSLKTFGVEPQMIFSHEILLLCPRGHRGGQQYNIPSQVWGKHVCIHKFKHLAASQSRSELISQRRICQRSRELCFVLLCHLYSSKLRAAVSPWGWWLCPEGANVPLQEN